MPRNEDLKKEIWCKMQQESQVQPKKVNVWKAAGIFVVGLALFINFKRSCETSVEHEPSLTTQKSCKPSLALYLKYIFSFGMMLFGAFSWLG